MRPNRALLRVSLLIPPFFTVFLVLISSIAEGELRGEMQGTTVVAAALGGAVVARLTFRWFPLWIAQTLFGLSALLWIGVSILFWLTPASHGYDARSEQTEVQMSLIATQMESFRALNGHYPDQSSQDSTLPAVINARYQKDAWGRPIRYKQATGKLNYEITSAGPDGVFGTSDDPTRIGQETGARKNACPKPAEPE